VSESPESSHWAHRDLLDIERLSAEDIRHVLRTALGFEDVSTRSVKKVPALRGRFVVNLFFEDSTRTRASFTLAASRLSADVLDFSASGSSVSKGETLRDTARNIEAMGVDAIVCRHQLSGAAVQLSRAVDCSIINAGDGQHAHPTQGLLDVFTMAKRLNREESFDFTGLRVAIIGDIAHSRVARSNIHALRKLGAEIVLIGPPTLLPGAFKQLGCELATDLDAVLPHVDVINTLRVQFGRLQSQAFPSVREYETHFGLTEKRMKRARDNVVVMHPGPINRGIEMDSAVADGPNSAILEQVSNGLAIRMATLFLTTGARNVQQTQTTEAEAVGTIDEPGW